MLSPGCGIQLELAGGSCDGRKDVTKGFFMRGGREMDNHFEVMWDMFRDVPSLEKPGVSVLDECYWLNKHDPNYSLCRATVNCGDDAHTDKKFNLDKESAMALSKLFITPEKDLEGKKISDVLPDSFWETNFWLCWQTMFAFQGWSGALEMKRYLCRYVHHIDGLPDFSALRITKLEEVCREWLHHIGVPEVWGSKYDVRELLRACYYAMDKKPITDVKLSFKEKEMLKVVMKKVQGTDIEILLKESGLIG